MEGGIQLSSFTEEVALKDRSDASALKSPRAKKSLSSTFEERTNSQRWGKEYSRIKSEQFTTLPSSTNSQVFFEQSPRQSVPYSNIPLLEENDPKSINPCANCMRKLSVISPGSYAFIRWLTYVGGRSILFLEIILNLYLMLAFYRAKDAFYFASLAVFVLGPYILLWNAGMKLIYKYIFTDMLVELTLMQKLMIIVYLFPFSGVFFTMIADLSYFLYMITRRTMWIFSGQAVFQSNYGYIESVRGVYSFFCEGLCKTILFAYLLTPIADINADFENIKPYITYGLIVSGLNALRNLWRLFKEAKNESMGIFQFLFFRLQLAEITMPAYLPKMGAIYRGTISVANYASFPLTSESSSQLVTAAQQSSSLKTLRFSEDTIAEMPNDAIRVFSAALKDKAIIWMKLLNATHVDNLWREILFERSQRKGYIKRDEWRRYCGKNKISENVNEVFDEMADTYPDRVYKRDVLDWVLTNNSEYRFNILDIAFPLHDAIKKHATKRFHFCCVREECYVQDPDGMSVWMTAVKAKLNIEDFVSYLLINESEFDMMDKDGRTFIDHLFDCDKDYIIDMINHLARRVNMWELTRKTFIRQISRKCIQLFFDDEFCASFEPQLFDYRALFSDESLALYGYPGWDEFIKAHRSYYWSDVSPVWVGKYFKKEIIKWYIKVHYNDGENERKRRYREIVEGLCMRFDSLGPYLLLECLYMDSSLLVDSNRERPTDYIVTGISRMYIDISIKIKESSLATNSLGASDVKILAQQEVTRLFTQSLEIHMPSTIIDLYFDDYFVQEVERKAKLDFRALFTDDRLENFQFKDFKAFVNNFESRHILHRLKPHDVGRLYDNRIISWYLSETDNSHLVAQAIWNRKDGNNMYYLLDCCSDVRSIVGMLNLKIQSKEMTKDDLKKQFEDVFEFYLPQQAVALFFDDRFLNFLNGMDFDYRDFVLKYIYRMPEFIDLLQEAPDQEKIHSMVEAHMEATQPRWERKKKTRYKAVQEFVETEMRFFKEMENMKLEYIFPVLDLNILKEDELESLFPDVMLDILRFSTDLSQDLELMWVEFDDDTTLVSEVISSYMGRVGDTFYKYSCGYSERVATLKRFEDVKVLKPILCPEEFNSHFANCQNIPLTRPTRYGMLVKEILKNTPPHHVDYHGLARMQKLLHVENIKINERIKEWDQENAVRNKFGMGPG